MTNQSLRAHSELIAAREALATDPVDIVLQAALLWALHNVAARYRQAGEPAAGAGLGTEGAGVLEASTATGAVLLDMATNLIYIAAYMGLPRDSVTGWVRRPGRPLGC